MSLIEAGARVLAEEGRPAVTARRLATEAGTSTMAVYTHFGSMEELFVQMCQEGFARFGVANRLLDYADASTAGYPSTPSSRTWGLGPNQRGARTQSWKINHLATRYFSFVPGKLASTTGTLRLWITLPTSSARASLVIVRTDNSRTVRYLKQTATGQSNPRLGFGRGTIKRVDLVLSNGSTRFACWTSFVPPFYSCFGRPLDDGRAFTFRAQLSQ